MYIPEQFREDNIDVMHDFIAQHNFAMLVTIHDGVPLATHLPILLDRGSGQYGMLRGHMARANEQWRTFAETRETLVIFSGPHAYISPSWYVTDVEISVPTWNYAAVHAYGVPRIIEDEDVLYQLLKDSVGMFESGFVRPWQLQEQGDFTRNKMRAIVGFEIPITRLEGKWKMSQNRSAEDRKRVVTMLQNSHDPIAKLIP